MNSEQFQLALNKLIVSGINDGVNAHQMNIGAMILQLELAKMGLIRMVQDQELALRQERAQDRIVTLNGQKP